MIHAKKMASLMATASQRSVKLPSDYGCTLNICTLNINEWPESQQQPELHCATQMHGGNCG